MEIKHKCSTFDRCLKLASAATQQIDTAAAELNAAQKGYDLANLRFNAGKSVAAERLDALSALTRARADSATASANLIDSRLRLQTAMGIQL